MIILSSVIIVIAVVLDQITKIAADAYLQDGAVAVIPKILSFSYVRNPGAAFGILSDNRWVFMLFSTVAIGVMVYLVISSKKTNRLFTISLSMLIGGGIGNMIDRVFRGYVVDFFKLEFIDFAVFNVADCFVTVGAFLLGIYLIFIYDEKKEYQVPPNEKETMKEETKIEVNESASDKDEADKPVESDDANEPE